MTLADAMILTGSLTIFALAYYWMRRAVKAERRVDALQSDAIATVEFYERFAADARKAAETRENLLRGETSIYRDRLRRIISLQTPNMAHAGKKAVAIARGDA